MPYFIKQVIDNLSKCSKNIKLFIENLSHFASTGYGLYNLNVLNNIQDQITTMDINELRTTVKTTKVMSEIIEKIIDQEEKRRKWNNELAILQMKEDNKQRQRQRKENVLVKRMLRAASNPYAVKYDIRSSQSPQSSQSSQEGEMLNLECH
jgi:hypothetical protein